MRSEITTIAISLATVCLFITSGISYAALEDGLVSAWTFDDGSANDFWGDNHGEIIGGVEAVDGKFDKALSFDGVDGYIEIPHNETMNVLENAFTFAAWIQPRTGAIGNSGIAGKGPGTGWGIKYSFKITLNWWGVSNASTEGYFNTGGVLNKPGEWVLACLTADGAQAIGYSAIEGGEVVINTSGEGNPKTIASPYLIEPDFPIEIGVGRMADGNTDRYFNGIIDEVLFWNRALTEDEVAELADGGRPQLAVEPSGKLGTLWGAIKQL